MIERCLESSFDLDPRRVAAQVPPELFRRHLGLPPDAELDEGSAALASAASAWYAANGLPWARSVVREVERVEGDRILLAGGQELTSVEVAAGLREAEVHAVAIVAVSAGESVDAEVDRRWKDGFPDEAMFLSAFAVAVAEHLRETVTRAVADEALRSGAVALPRHAPGYDGWSLADQAALVAALDDCGPLRVLPSGGLAPQKSAVAAVGLTRRVLSLAELDGFWSRSRAEPAPAAIAAYAYPERALEKWSRERLTLSRPAQGRLVARFRFDGKTCSSLGRPLAFDYEVELGDDAADGYRLVGGRCAPAADDSGHRATCEYLGNPEAFLAALGEPAPLLGEPLDAAIRWQPFESPSGCLCSAANRAHKWKIVYQTIHFALRRLETSKVGDETRE